MSPEKAKETVKAFGDSITPDNADVLEVEVIDWDTIVGFDASPVRNLERKVKLEDFLKRLWDNRAKMKEIENYLYL